MAPAKRASDQRQSRKPIDEPAAEAVQAVADGRRTYVLDTSVLLADPGAIRRFEEHEVVLPVVVITELEGKRHHPELGYFARSALRMLDELRVQNGRLDEPVVVSEEGGTVRVELNHTDAASLPSGFRLGDNDTRILAVARNLANEGYAVTLVSKDLPLRIKASAVGLDAAEYRGEQVHESDSGWTGMQEVDVTGLDLDELYDDQVLDLDDARDLPCHTGLVLMSERGSALGRVKADKRVHLVRGDREAFGIHGRSAEQRIALDLLLDPEIGIVSLGGRAGTGKSALALCAGLETVLERRTHKKVVVFRPLFAVGGQELGYLPGSESEKMSPWGQAVFDTLGAITTPDVVDEVLDRGHARGDAADPHPRPLAARRVRDRRRGAVAGAQRAAHRALAHGCQLQGGADPRRGPARQPQGRSPRRRGRGRRPAQGAPAVRARDPHPLGALADRGPGHRDAGARRDVTRLI